MLLNEYAEPVKLRKNFIGFSHFNDQKQSILIIESIAVQMKFKMKSKWNRTKTREREIGILNLAIRSRFGIAEIAEESLNLKENLKSFS